jgi:predicted kinase
MTKCIAVGMIGAMGSGKSTIAKLLCAENNLRYLSPDLYWERDEPYTWEKSVDNWSKVIANQYKCVKMGISFLVDTASRIPIARQEMTRVIRGWDHGTSDHEFHIIGAFIKVDLETCLRRNAGRQSPQPERCVREYWQKIQDSPPDADKDGFDQIYTIENNLDTDLPKIWLPKLGDT